VAGRPTLAPDLDQLALRVSALLNVKHARRFWNGIEHRIMRSPAYLEWSHQPETYLQDLDADTTETIRRHLNVVYQNARAEARSLGWDLE
jgi:hypothetical protein